MEATRRESIAARDRSYRTDVQRGSRVIEVKTGLTGTALTVSNAGFRGIEAFVQFDNGERRSVSTGRLGIR